MNQPEIITETNDYFVINKPAEMACEPPSHLPTLRDWLIEHGQIRAGDWDEENRFGIVHRLDTDTSGVTIWAKTKEAQERLKLLWQGRQTEKTYLALVVGETKPAGEIDLAITRDNRNDKQKVVMLNDGSGRPAITRFKRLAVGESNGQKVSLVEAHPVTGRTHQIRVHFKAIGHPLVGDKLYGEKATDQVAAATDLTRQFLHASRLCVDDHCYDCPLPADLIATLERVGITEYS